MRCSELCLPELVETQRDASASSLLVSGGYVLPLTDGVFSLLPLGLRMVRKLAAIADRELARLGAQELLMPVLQPREIWERGQPEAGESRASAYGPELFQLTDRAGRKLVLGPTHEEVAAIVAAACIRDRAALPRYLYQLQPKFRDQPAGDEGLIRTREFLMQDLYSFDADRAGLDRSYLRVREAYRAFFARCGLRCAIVAADGGAIGDGESEEFLALLANGRHRALSCPACGFAASCDVLPRRPSARTDASAPLPLEEVEVDDGWPLERQAALLGIALGQRLLTRAFVAGGRALVAVLPADVELNPAKLVAAAARAGLRTGDLHVADAAELRSLGLTFAGLSPLHPAESVAVIADIALEGARGFALPSDRVNHSFRNIDCARDLRVARYADLGSATEGSACERCGGALNAIAGVEVAQIFKLGSRYSAAFGAAVPGPGPDAGAIPLEMGCYGIGITRTLATLVEQHRDQRGIVWPRSVAPFELAILACERGASSDARAEELYLSARDAGIEVLLDDSRLGLEHKRRRADLLGLPLQAELDAETEASQRVVLRSRRDGAIRCVPAADLIEIVRADRGAMRSP